MKYYSLISQNLRKFVQKKLIYHYYIHYYQNYSHSIHYLILYQNIINIIYCILLFE